VKFNEVYFEKPIRRESKKDKKIRASYIHLNMLNNKRILLVFGADVLSASVYIKIIGSIDWL